MSDAKERLMEAVLDLIWQGSFGATTIDQICEKAGVKKGSFYYFFESKSDVAAAALEADWQNHKAELDGIFSPTTPPLDRIKNFCEMGYLKQAALKKSCGCVLGCPLFTVGSEICHRDEKLHGKIKEILMNFHCYIESAIRDAHAAGKVDVADPTLKARLVFAYCQGLMTQARILNDVEVLRHMFSGVLALLEVRSREKVAA